MTRAKKNGKYNRNIKYIGDPLHLQYSIFAVAHHFIPHGFFVPISLHEFSCDNKHNVVLYFQAVNFLQGYNE
jgi:hypothetical protein